MRSTSPVTAAWQCLGVRGAQTRTALATSLPNHPRPDQRLPRPGATATVTSGSARRTERSSTSLPATRSGVAARRRAYADSIRLDGDYTSMSSTWPRPDMRNPRTCTEYLEHLRRIEEIENDDLQRALRLSLQEAEDNQRAEEVAPASARATDEEEDALVALQLAELVDAERLSPTDQDEDTRTQCETPECPCSYPEPEQLEQPSDECNESPAASSKPPAGVVRTFAPRRWLSDASITYVYEHIMKCSELLGLSNEGLDKLPDDILLIDAATTFWLAMQTRQSVVKDMIAPLRLEERKLVLCPLNNSRDRINADGGSHWGLLVWDRREIGTLVERCTEEAASVGRFFYYDSGHFRGLCQSQADRVASRLVGQRVRTILGDNAFQSNGYDCGMYVLMFTAIVIDSFLKDVEDTSHSSKLSRHASAWDKRLKSLLPADVTGRRAALYHSLRMAELDDGALSATRGGA